MQFRTLSAMALFATCLTLSWDLSASDKAATAPVAKTASKATPKADVKIQAKADTTPEAKAATDAKADAKDAASDKQAKANAEDRHKSKGLAGGLAFFPGVAVHGAGHMYAGSWMKGLGLLAVEGVSAYYIADTIVNGQNDIEKITKGNSGIPIDVSTAYTKVGILTVSSMAFLWSWFDDMAGAPIAVTEYNKLQDEAVASVHIIPREDGATVALSTAF